MADSVQIKFDSSRLVASLTRYEQSVRECIRPAAYAGASLLYDEMRRRVPVGKKPSVIRRKVYPPGLLKSSIYRYFVNDVVNPDRATYHVGPNKRKAGHWSWVEHGHWAVTERDHQRKTRKGFIGPVKKRWVPAQPYIRPTWDGQGHAAVQQMKATLKARLAQRRGAK